MKRMILLILAVLLIAGSTLSAQSIFTPDDHLVNGYANKISGMDFEYTSCIPGQRECMLLRATNGKDFIEWETDPVSAAIKEKFATFVWIAALGSGPGRARMGLAINGNQKFSLYTDARPTLLVKKSITDPESFYIAFPFDLKDGKHFTELQGGVIETGKDQIKGSSNDWYTVQNFTSVRNSASQIVVGSAEMPLMQFGAINTGRYQAGAMPQTTNLFSWPMNNYWTTNFNAEQRGGHSWNYYLTSSDDNSNGFATRFGWGCRIAYLTRILPGSGAGDNNWEGSFISGWPSNVILITAEPTVEGNSILIHLRETDGKTSDLKLANGINGKALRLTEVDVTGSNVTSGSNEIGPLESKFFRIEL